LDHAFLFPNPVAPYWMDAAQAALDNIKNSILSDPCIVHVDYRKLFVLWTILSHRGLGWVLCQPGDDTVTNQVMQGY
jgi:hypothetical protein